MIKLLNLALRSLSAVAPGLGARVADHFWFAIPKPRITEDARKALATGTRFELPVERARVVAWRWGGAGAPAVILMHGWGGNAGQLTAFVEPLTRAGFQVLAFDAPSHGFSGSSKEGAGRATLFDFSDALIAVSRDAPTVAGIVAHSGGCAAVAWALSKQPELRPGHIVFIAPFGSPSRYMALFQKTLGLSDEAMRRFRAGAERRLDFRWDDFEVRGAVLRINAPPPLLVIHDRDDRETSYEDGVEISEKWPRATLRTTTGLGHARILHDPATIDSAVSFLAGR